MLELRRAQESDIPALLDLYAYMSGDSSLPAFAHATQTLRQIAAREDQHLLVGLWADTVVCSLTVTVLQSLTHGCRPYAVVEHVVTAPEYGGRGFAGSLLRKAEHLAREADCYKCMLITSRQTAHVHRLYQKAGYQSNGYCAYTLYL